MYDILELSKKLLPELKEIAKELNIKRAELLKKQDLIYRILDQQAIESTETKPVVKPKPAEEMSASAIEKEKEEAEAALRRGKRPRTLKPVINRPVESVMSVSPDDLKRPDTRPADWQDQTKSPNCSLNRTYSRNQIQKRKIKFFPYGKKSRGMITGLKRRTGLRKSLLLNLNRDSLTE
jgi:hypothetical protein